MVLGVSNRGDLEPYRRKRDPDRTPEPFGDGASASPPGGAVRFVVQLHRARRLHYDFRFEHGGVLKSWAVPKGFALDPKEKRLAVAVEDHPLEYGGFEGIIAPGNYGAGAVIVWDRGLLRAMGDLGRGLDQGRLEFTLEGYKLRGAFVLVRTRGSDGTWLLIKKHDAYVRSEDPGRSAPRSVLSGRTVDELASGGSRLDGVVQELEARGVPRRAIPARERNPMLATLEREPFDRPGWVFEIKYDGVRVLAERSGDRVRLVSRGGRDLGPRFPELLPCLRSLVAERYLIDGELVAPDAHGRLSLAGLQERLHLRHPRDIARAATVPAELVVFDCLALEGFDCRRLPLLERKALVRRLVPPVGPVSYCEHLTGSGIAIFEAAAAHQLEGIIAKRADSSYAGRRSRDWLKIKCTRQECFVIGGFTAARGSRAGLGALLVGQYAGERLTYAGRVGSGLSDDMSTRLMAALAAREASQSTFADPPARLRARWVRPELVCEVRFAERTAAGQLRHPRFVRLRDDMSAHACVIPAAQAEEALPGPIGDVAGGHGRLERPPPVAAIALSNVDKVFFPDAGYTKGDVIDYYRRIAPLLLPYLRDRPLTLTRYPDGIEGKYFYQQDAPDWVPGWVRRVRLYSKEGQREIEHFVCDSVQALVYLANLGCIPLHVWNARLGALDRPDWLVLDLDPGEASFAAVVAVAHGLRRLLRTIGLRAFPKTSGATGLHLLLPLGARYPHSDVKRFAEVVARVAAERLADIATVERRPARREGKVYIDYGQNGYGRTIAAPYAVRARTGAPVSAPLRWTQVRAGLDPARFTIKTLPERIRRAADDPLRAVLGPGCDLGTALARLERDYV
jgi:bifunctional non-homologous end joining protein LigD